MCVCGSSSKACFQHVTLSPALKCSSPAWNAFISSVKSVHPQHKMRLATVWYSTWRRAGETISFLAIKTFVFNLEIGLEPPKRTESGEKQVSTTLYIKYGWTWKNVQKQGSERTQEDYLTTESWQKERQENYLVSAVYFCRGRVVFLCPFIFALFLYFFKYIPAWNKVFHKHFFLVYV